MNEAVKTMLKQYGKIQSPRDEDYALKEIIQSITLLGLHRGGFFNIACFYGGTALRILYNLDRFSEDMDFCLMKKDPTFSLKPYFQAIRDELERFGMPATIEEKRTGINVAVESAFVKQETIIGLMSIGRDARRAQKGQLIKVKLEVDKSNPEGFIVDKKLVKLPIPFMVNTLTEESLFAGKVHALLARPYANRVKGRDYYDFMFYVSRNTKINGTYLEAKLRDSAHYTSVDRLDQKTLVRLLKEKFANIDFEKAKDDVRPFLPPARERDLAEWSCDLFSALAETIDIST